MLNVLVTTGFPDAEIARIQSVSPDVTVTRAPPDKADYGRADVLYAVNPPRDLARAPGLKWVQLHMAGINTMHDHPLYTSTAVALTTTSGVHASTVAEYAVTMLLALAHRVPRMVEWQGKGRWPADGDRWRLFVPTEIHGATMGIIGYGSIGRELARIVKTAFSMTVLACKRDPTRRADTGYCRPGTGDPEGVLPDEWLSPAELPSLLARSDVVVMAAPLTQDTHHMLGEPAFRTMKPSAYFINVGRGPSVDEPALARALNEHRIAGAAVDVFSEEPPPQDNPLYRAENVMLSPHVSGFLPSYDTRCTDLFTENLRRYLAGAPLLNLVDRAKGY